MRPNNEILIDYLDRQLSREESTQVENMAQKDTMVASELQYLKLAIDTVRLDAINEKVSAIRQSRENDRKSTDRPAKAIVRSMYKISMRVAAIFIVLIGVTVLYKYASVNNQSVYNKQFTGYELSNTRGQETRDAEVEAYRNKNWNEVIAIYNAEANKSNKSGFLAAMAEMQLNHFPQAVALFENILNANAKSGDSSFQEEAEYYISLAYLMNHEENKSIQMMNKIKADTSHTYYPLVSKLSPIDLKIIELKK
jgi:hypothetical protein